MSFHSVALFGGDKDERIIYAKEFADALASLVPQTYTIHEIYRRFMPFEMDKSSSINVSVNQLLFDYVFTINTVQSLGCYENAIVLCRDTPYDIDIEQAFQEEVKAILHHQMVTFNTYYAYHFVFAVDDTDPSLIVQNNSSATFLRVSPEKAAEIFSEVLVS